MDPLARSIADTGLPHPILVDVARAAIAAGDAASARARAYLHGRAYATPEDVAVLAGDILAHRLGLTWRATAEGETPRGVVARLVERVVPL